jgi:hypothetical protein
MQTIRHVSESYWNWFESEAYFRSRLSDILFIGFQESLNADFDTLKQVLGLPNDAQLPSDPVKAHRNPHHVDRTLDNTAIENLKNWYSKDYQFFHLCQQYREQACRANGFAAPLRSAG